MATLRNQGLWGFACLLTLWAGCVVPTAPPADDSSNDSTESSFKFADDADPAQAALPFVETELLVQPYPGADPQALADLYDEIGATVEDELTDIQLTVLNLPGGDLQAAARRLSDSGLLEGLHKNYILQAQLIPNDPLFARQPHLPQIGAPEAWDITTGASEILLAIVDTGVDALHPDLSAKVVDGWNVYDGNSDFKDAAGHGTLAAGVAAASSDNNSGVTGVAWSSPILAVRATDAAGQSTGRHLAAGILWAVSHGAKVINVSFAPLWSNSVVQSAAVQAFNRGSLVVIAAGNGGGMNSAPGYPEALFVGAVDAADAIASFSDRGPFVDLVAPGTGIRSTAIGSQYTLANGTSFAAPIVSGVAALAWSVNPDLRPASIVDALVGSAVDLGTTGQDATFGVGEVDALAAVQRAEDTVYSPDTTSPTLRITKPIAGDTLSGRATVTATATDASGVADVVLSIDGLPFATDTRARYQFVIDTATFASGEHELAFVAADVVGNASAPQTLSVRFADSSGGGVDGSSTITGVSFRSPLAGSTVSGNVTLSATVSASNGLAVVEWFVDDDSVFVSALSGQSSGISYLWRTAGEAAGNHTITLVVTDSQGKQVSGRLALVLR